MKIWAMLWRATQDEQVTAENSDKMWSHGGGTSKPFQYTYCETLMNCIKGQKMSPPGLKVSKMLWGRAEENY